MRTNCNLIVVKPPSLGGLLLSLESHKANTEARPAASTTHEANRYQVKVSPAIIPDEPNPAV